MPKLPQNDQQHCQKIFSFSPFSSAARNFSWLAVEGRTFQAIRSSTSHSKLIGWTAFWPGQELGAANPPNSAPAEKAAHIPRYNT